MPLPPPDTPDPALGVFETLLVRHRRAQAPTAHLRRLAASVSELYREELPGDLEHRLAERAAQLPGEHRLRLDAVPGPGRLRLTWRAIRLGPAARTPVACQPAILTGGLGGHKWCDRRPVDRLGAAGAVPLICDLDGAVLEAGWANLWLIEGRRLITPPADGRLLPGVTRERLLRLGPRLGLEVVVAAVTTARLRAAEGLFLTSSVRQAVGAQLAGDLAPGPAGAEIRPLDPWAPADHPAIAAIRRRLGEDGW